MKKIVLTLILGAAAVATVAAQEIPERKADGYKPHAKHRMHGKRDFANLNLTQDQKDKFKALSEEQRAQMSDLKKQDNITVKESREKMEALHKDYKQKRESILTSEQKTQLQKDRAASKERAMDSGRKRGERMKQELNLSDEQSAKLTENRKQMSENMKSIRENAALTDVQKKEQTRELMKKQHESMKSILTEEQMEKFKQQRKRSDRKMTEKSST